MKWNFHFVGFKPGTIGVGMMRSNLSTNQRLFDGGRVFWRLTRFSSPPPPPTELTGTQSLAVAQSFEAVPRQGLLNPKTNSTHVQTERFNSQTKMTQPQEVLTHRIVARGPRGGSAICGYQPNSKNVIYCF